MVFELNKWLENKREGDVIVEHIGDFTSAYIDSVLVGVEEKLVDRVDLDNVRKKVFHIFVECIQNLYHHVEPVDGIEVEFGSNKLGAILLVKDGSFCRVTTGNFVSKEKVMMLKGRIEVLNSMTEAEVKSLYRETINNKEFSNKGGAGIGMIDMARKTGNKLGYTFYEVEGNPNLSFFSSDVHIS
jgi:hypothetical protein